MRKFTLSVLITASILSAAAFSVMPVNALPSDTREHLTAQADFDLPGDFPGSGSGSSGSSARQQRSSGSPRTEQTSRQQAAPASDRSENTYTQPSSSIPANDPGVPPDIENAPPPYVSEDAGVRQQAQIIGDIRPVIAEPGPIVLPHDFNRRPLVGILKVDQNGVFSHEAVKLNREDQFGSADIVTGADNIIAPGLSARLSSQQIKALLGQPQTILSSRYAATVFNCQRVLLLPPKKSSGYYGIEVDLRTLAKRKVYTSKNDSESKAHGDILDQVLRNANSYNTPVKANRNSFKYHRADADHLSKSSPTQEYANADAAKQAGLTPCPLCYPETEYQNSYSSAGPAAVPDDLPLSQNTHMVERLSSVAVQLAYANRLSPQTYRVYLLADPDYRAFSYVGGPILISDGLLNILDTPGEVASIVSHEMAHLCLGHVTLKPQQVQNGDQSEKKKGGVGSYLGSMAGSALGSVVAYSTGSYWAGWGARKAVDLGQRFKIKFPKHYEEAADRQAVIMSFKAGYSPEDFVLTINKIGSIYQQRSDNEWLIEHRKTNDRQDNIRGLVGQLGSMEVDLRAWENDDPTLCVAWRQQVQTYLDHPHTFEDFADAYQIAKDNAKH